MSNKSNRGGRPIARPTNPPQQHVTMTYSAPIPTPDMIERYNQIHPDLGTDIVRNFNSEVPHRRSVELEKLAQSRMVAENNIEISKRNSRRVAVAMYGVLLLLGVFMIFSMWLVATGRPVEGWVAILAEVAAIAVAVRFNGKKSSSEKTN